jgi:hypothetical protein
MLADFEGERLVTFYSRRLTSDPVTDAFVIAPAE